MDTTHHHLQELYTSSNLDFSNLKKEEESSEYEACTYTINGLFVISRKAKITPKKVGQFVTFWKRINNGIIQPFDTEDNLDFFTIHSFNDDKKGLFVFSRDLLISKKILSTNTQEGKRGFRVYPPWHIAVNKQAVRTQKWQLECFINIENGIDIEKLRSLYVL